MMPFKTLKDHVYDYISDEIRNNNIKPNEKISENKICEALNVSRTPVREALIELASVDILKREPRKGFVVKEVTLKKIKETYMILGVLEGLATKLAVDHLTEEDIKELETLIDEIETGIDEKNYYEYYKLQFNFHSIINNASHNMELVKTIENLKKSFIKQTYNMEHTNKEITDMLKITNSEHKEIVRLIKEKDREGVEDYLRNVHWNISYAKFDAIWD